MSTYIFDLDGTLVDSSERLYQLFQFLIPESVFSKEEYWSMKRNKINHQMILEQYFPKYNFYDFNIKWLSLIESTQYLDLDTVYDDTIHILKKLYHKNELYLLTARQDRINLIAELTRLNILPFFKEIFVTENKTSKDTLLKEIKYIPNDFFISDMGHDIETGNRAGLKTIAITHGFMNREKLLSYSPWKVVDNLSEIPDVLTIE